MGQGGDVWASGVLYGPVGVMYGPVGLCMGDVLAGR